MSTAERTGKYFHSFQSEHIPEVTWSEVLDRGILLPPETLILILQDAKDYLSTTEGPNLENRKKFSEEWFRYWRWNLNAGPNSDERIGALKSKLTPFSKVRDLLDWKTGGFIKDSGLLTVAAAEGHAGHVLSAVEMAGKVTSVWAFEQDSYFKYKERTAPFLPLQVRLWMWCYSPVDIITVCPKVPSGVDLNTHYKKLFDETGANRCFSDEEDPNWYIKIRRGNPGPRGFEDNLLGHVDTFTTSQMVQKLRGGDRPPDHISNFGIPHESLILLSMGITNRFLETSRGEFDPSIL